MHGHHSPEGQALLPDFFRAAPVLATIAMLLLISPVLLRIMPRRRVETAVRSPRLSMIWGVLSLAVAIIAAVWWTTRTDLLQRPRERQAETSRAAALAGDPPPLDTPAAEHNREEPGTGADPSTTR